MRRLFLLALLALGASASPVAGLSKPFHPPMPTRCISPLEYEEVSFESREDCVGSARYCLEGHYLGVEDYPSSKACMAARGIDVDAMQSRKQDRHCFDLTSCREGKALLQKWSALHSRYQHLSQLALSAMSPDLDERSQENELITKIVSSSRTIDLELLRTEAEDYRNQAMDMFTHGYHPSFAQEIEQATQAIATDLDQRWHNLSEDQHSTSDWINTHEDRWDTFTIDEL